MGMYLNYLHDYIYNHLDIQLLTARITGMLTYFMTYLFDFKNFLAVFSTNINVADEILVGLVRISTAIISAIAILFFTDVYKFLKKKIWKIKDEEPTKD